MSKNDQNLDENSKLSKTQAKKQVEDLQDLGVSLTKLKKAQLEKFDLPEVLLLAVLEAQKLTANGAIRRHNQYIGRLMRNVDADIIREKLDALNGIHVGAIRKLHECENWREQLLKNDTELNAFIQSYPSVDINQLRSLIRQVRKELAHEKQHNYRKLFQYIREIVGNT